MAQCDRLIECFDRQRPASAIQPDADYWEGRYAGWFTFDPAHEDATARIVS